MKDLHITVYTLHDFKPMNNDKHSHLDKHTCLKVKLDRIQWNRELQGLTKYLFLFVLKASCLKI